MQILCKMKFKKLQIAKCGKSCFSCFTKKNILCKTFLWPMTRASQSLEAFEVSEVSGHYIDTWATPADVRKSTLFFQRKSKRFPSLLTLLRKFKRHSRTFKINREKEKQETKIKTGKKENRA